MNHTNRDPPLAKYKPKPRVVNRVEYVFLLFLHPIYETDIACYFQSLIYSGWIRGQVKTFSRKCRISSSIQSFVTPLILMGLLSWAMGS
jgi:hypothetical protein